jgi:pyruvate dehydrogenase E2 component (dihydrolipoamide acetyltransferase)
VPEIVMPRLSDSMEEGTILKWMKSVGDEVAVGDELVEIETDKANMVYESDAAGTLSEIVAQEGDTLPIGEVIARVGEGGGGGAPTAAKKDAAETAGNGGDPEPRAATQAPPAPPPAPASAAAAAPPAPATTGDGRVKASPIARRIAQEKGIDLTALQGSGPGGRIVKADVEGAPALAPTQPASYPAAPGRAAEEAAGIGSVETAKGQTTYQELTKLQATVARRMAESKATAPHFYLNAEIDMSRAVAARARIKAAAAEGEIVPSFNDMVVKACAIALREHPRANAAYRDGRFELYSRVNVGVAVAAQEALVVPTVFDADLKGLRQIAANVRELAAKVRDGTVIPPELSGGTFTVSNLGMYGIDSFAAVINTPQAGILSVGAISERPVVRDSEITTAHLMAVTLACDHRILYGADGAAFLARIRALLEEPVSLAL